MKTAELRQAFLSFFEENGHKIVPSSTLVPKDDPTLLFTNAGMNQFKDPLLGRSDPGYTRATSSQRCVRAGGKHNDLENVGYTARHHTFFEMLGNFSFGDYFKEETIHLAWRFITEKLALPKEKIWVTVHPTDAESRSIWIEEIGIPADRVIDLEENFWTMGDTGPCGPCTELFYDHGPEIEGGPPGSPEEDGDRYIEFWNLVFPQFDRSADGTLTPLPKPGVDTGMGLERITAIMQGVHSNYEIDLFRNLIGAAGQFAGINDVDAAIENPSVRVIADHIRSCAFLIADGVIPGNEDRAYVLRRIIRRALRHGNKLGISEPFFHKLVDVLVEEMGDAYPVLVEQQRHIEQVLRSEEARFSETLHQGMELLKNHIETLEGNTLSGEVVFQLYDTYGFPADLTADVARERNLEVDMAGFESAMEAQRSRGRAAASFSASLAQRVSVASSVDFLGYQGVADSAAVEALFDLDGKSISMLQSGERGVVVLDRTPFYAESGGQVGDQGQLIAGESNFRVDDTLITGNQHMHVGEMQAGSLSVQEKVLAEVDEQRRDRIRANHSATHLLHAALRQVLGEHVQQKGSLVNDEKLRFDFSHSAAVSAEQLRTIEDLVNAQIRKNSAVETDLMSYDEAVGKGAMALFGEKYADQVRVLTMGGGYSVELCGGTHVQRTGDIGLFKITAETGIAAGIRRIEAVTGQGALALIRQTDQILERLSQLLKAGRGELFDRVHNTLAENRQLQKQLSDVSQKMAANQGTDLVAKAVDLHGVKFLASEVEGDNKAMMQTLDTLRSQLGDCVVVLAHVDNGKVGAVVGVSRQVVDKVTAPDVMAQFGPFVGAKGGGRPDLARAGGGTRPSGLAEAFAAAQTFVAERLA
ncbi:MAG: alanine--tRNA ligase [bacterium]